MISSNPIAYYSTLTIGTFAMSFCVVFAFADCCRHIYRRRRWARAASDDVPLDDDAKGAAAHRHVADDMEEQQDDSALPRVRV